MRFFFYGTLLAGSDNPVASFVHEKLELVGPATARGALHGVPDPDGWYPALLPGEGEVHGRLYAAGESFTAADLARLDAYEDFDPARPEASLYLRLPVAVRGPDGAEQAAQAYVFNRPLPDGARPIPEGDFRAWLDGQGLAQFRGLRES